MTFAGQNSSGLYEFTVQSSTVREILVIRSRRALSADDLQHLVEIIGATDKGLVFLDNHELDVAQRSKVVFPEVSLQFAIGNAAEPPSLA